MKKLQVTKAIGAGVLGSMMLFGATQTYAAALYQPLVQAAPIWNNTDAKTKCPSLQSKYNSKTWKGSWTTTAWGRMSGCWLAGLTSEQLGEQEVQLRVYNSLGRYTNNCLGNYIQAVGQEQCNPFDQGQVFKFDFASNSGSVLKRINSTSGDEECLAVGKSRSNSIPKANDPVSYRACDPVVDSHQTWIWDSEGNLKPETNQSVCMALVQGGISRLVKCSDTSKLAFWSPNIIAFR